MNAQLSPVYGIHTDDYNGDENLDMILADNFFGFRIDKGRYDANMGLLLIGDGKCHFEAIPNVQSGLFIDGEVKNIAEVQLADNKNLLFFLVNNNEIQLYEINDQYNKKAIRSTLSFTIILLIISGSCRKSSVKDLSLSQEEYRKMGIPDYNRDWTFKDYSETFTALIKVKFERPFTLPTKDSKRSGALFNRMISFENMSFLQDKSLSLNEKAH